MKQKLPLPGEQWGRQFANNGARPLRVLRLVPRTRENDGWNDTVVWMWDAWNREYRRGVFFQNTYLENFTLLDHEN